MFWQEVVTNNELVAEPFWAQREALSVERGTDSGDKRVNLLWEEIW